MPGLVPPCSLPQTTLRLLAGSLLHTANLPRLHSDMRSYLIDLNIINRQRGRARARLDPDFSWVFPHRRERRECARPHLVKAGKDRNALVMNKGPQGHTGDGTW